jgi:leucyl aminopeptidase
MPPSQLTPVALADKAEAIAKKHGLGCTIFSEEQIIKMGMGGLAGVSAGSENDCKLVILDYKCSKKDAQTIAFVGKGITFDSGGLSLKPASGMENMKDDMSGASAVISTMEALAQLKPDVNILGVAALAENMPSGKATKPGDILRFYNGKTAEVRNTDAEGRLVLADALAYVAKEYKPDAMIDLATLTGLCHYFFGPFYSALLSNNKKLQDEIVRAGTCTGERVWPLPYDDDYKQGITSHIADIQNTGKESIRSGTITAGHFLEHFVGDIPWAHLDIAGTSFETPMLPYCDKGATGVGVRLLIDLAQHWNS